MCVRHICDERIDELETESSKWLRIAQEFERKNENMEAQLAELRDALDKLARLGNEPNFGNSTGNRIAQAALLPTPEEVK